LAPRNAPSKKVAVVAVKAAAKKHAPGLLRPGAIGRPSGRRMTSGRWIRRGRKIILMGV
jgi:hypothetical protein